MIGLLNGFPMGLRNILTLAPLNLLAMIKAALIISMYTLCECVLPWDELIQGHSFLQKLYWPVATECDLLE